MAVVTIQRSPSLFVCSAHNSNYSTAREGSGSGVEIFPNGYAWVGQYKTGNRFEISQIYGAYDLSSIPAGATITGARLICQIAESYGTAVLEARATDWSTNTVALVPGSTLASKTLLGSSTVNGSFVGERVITLANVTRTNLEKMVFAVAAQRTGTAPTNDDTIRLDAAALEVTYTNELVQLITTVGVGSVTVPAGFNRVREERWSGAQGGAADRGGRGGNYSRTDGLTVTAGQVINYSVGQGGAGVQYASPNNGGDTWVMSSSTLLTKGGGNTTGHIGGTVNYYGGSGSAAGSFGGGGGGSAHPGGNGGNAPVFNDTMESLAGGSSGSTPGSSVSNVEGGSGGSGGSNNVPGGNPGGGGGGGYFGTGGTGGRGQIRLTFYYVDDGTPPADTTAPTITSTATISNAENSTLAHTLTANETVTWTIRGQFDASHSVDAHMFALSGSTLMWVSNSTRNFEAPNDSNTNNVYQVTVRATDGSGNFTDQNISVTVTDVYEPPIDTTAPTINSPASVSVDENTVNPTGTLTANEPVTWTKIGGTDSALFTLNGATWTLNATPDYETKGSYTVFWRATDAANNFTDQMMTLNVNDVSEGGTSQSFVIALTNSGTWTAPANITGPMIVHTIGGGGGNSTNLGSGGGAYTRKTYTPTAGQQFAYVAGAGGLSERSINAYDSTHGGDTWFGSATTQLAKGGRAGGQISGWSHGSGGDASQSIGDVKQYGGSGNGNGGGGAGGPNGDGYGSAPGVGGLANSGVPFSWTLTAGGTVSPGQGGITGTTTAQTDGKLYGGGAGAIGYGWVSNGGGAGIIVIEYSTGAPAGPSRKAPRSGSVQ